MKDISKFKASIIIKIYIAKEGFSETSRKYLQEYGILPHSRTYYCLLFSLYHMFIVFVISY